MFRSKLAPPFRLLLALLAIGIGAGALFAAPIENLPVTVSQPDGSTLHLFASGDEYYNWLHDADGYVIMRSPETGYFVYADKSGGQLFATNYRVDQVDPNSLSITPNLMPDARILKEYRETKFAIPEAPFAQKMANAPDFSAINNLAVFIRFSDDSEIDVPFTTFDNLFNEEGADVNSQIEYYRAASYNQLDISTNFYPVPDGALVVSYQDSLPRARYMKYDAISNPTGYVTEDERTQLEQSLIKRALVAVADSIPASLDLDGNNDGAVDNVVVIIKGWPEGWSDLLWPHMWALFNETVFLNGAQVWNYNLQLSDYLISRGVGVICHEMGHTLGAPDYYHYSSGENPYSPVSMWDLMNSDTDPPQHFSSYTKLTYMGWLDSIPTVSESDTITLANVTHPEQSAIFVPSHFSEDEYFMLEYRDKTADQFDGSLPNSGLVVYRINGALGGSGNSGGPPDELYVYRPGGTLTSNGSTSLAPLGSSTGRLEMNSSTDPSPFLSTGIPGGLSVSDVEVVGDSIRFVLHFPGPGPVTASAEISDSTLGSVSLSWTAPPEGTVTGYRIYRDFEMVGETADTSYNDLMSDYGFHTYYVVGVTDDSQETGPSPLVNVEWLEPGVVVLLWDADPVPASGDMLKQVLNNVGYGVRRVETLNDAIINGYPMIFATLGMASDGEHYVGTGGTEESKLIEYLDQGGILYMEGGDAFGWEPPENLLPYFNLTNLNDGTGDLSTVNGVAGTFAEGITMQYNGENSYIDHLEGGTGAQTILVNPADDAGCAVAYDEGTYKTIAVGFELGKLVDGQSPSTLHHLVESIMQWTGVPNPGYVSSVGDEIAGLPDHFEVLAPYPNPFNGITSVPILLNRSGRVEVSTFDILGRLVSSNDYQMQAGRQRITLTMPTNLASGVYFVKVGFTNQVQTRRIILVK